MEQTLGAGGSHARPLLSRVLRAAALVLGGVLILAGAWLALLGMPVAAAFTGALALLALLRARARLRLALAAGLLAVAALGWRLPARELGRSLERLREAKDRRGPAGLDLRDAAGVYGLNLAIGLGGLLGGFPEAARETLWLCVPGPDVRTWRSDFAMRSPRVRAEVQRLAGLVAREGQGGERVELPVVRIAWPAYAFATDSMRVALALNSPLELSGSAHRDGDRWRLELVGRARVEYPRRAVLTFGAVDGRPLAFDEGLLWALQERGWLHPYTAEWRFTVMTDDPRLDDLRTPDVSWRERLLAAVLGTR